MDARLPLLTPIRATAVLPYCDAVDGAMICRYCINDKRTGWSDKSEELSRGQGIRPPRFLGSSHIWSPSARKHRMYHANQSSLANDLYRQIAVTGGSRGYFVSEKPSHRSILNWEVQRAAVCER